ncbi:MAG TPA: DEAD/DEAH box helicase [Acidimicrobiales bacterium]|nr:DEAD/DEAH box helicase [Acidimicrobiales bacterium]
MPSPPASSSDRFEDTLDRLEKQLETWGEPAAAGTPGDETPPTLATVHRTTEPARSARFGDHEPPIDAMVRQRLGVDRLWRHQVDALDAVLAGRSAILTTGTASGKSLVAQAAIGTACAGTRPATALFLHPTKALGHDQLRALDALALPGVLAAAYDGDSSDTERVWVRRHANVVFTNPDMLHLGILPRHGQWETFLRRLRYVVVDEAHALRGIFGGHVAHVLRRLRRLCNQLGADPVFILASATVDDPARLATTLTGIEAITVIDEDGSPRGERMIAQVNPPLLDVETGARVSSHRVTATIAADLIAQGRRTIVFCRSRHSTETITAAIRRHVDADLVDKVQSYRAGYLSAERREIEAELSEGRLLGVVATNALELGIDIGGLDACVVHTFPGTVSSFRQQIGRAGRSQEPSLAVLVAGTDQLDQFLMNHPRELADRGPEPVVVNPSNENVLDPQIECAAAESPLTSADSTYWGEDLDDAIRRGVLGDRLRIQRLGAEDAATERRVTYAGHGHPAGRISLRSGSGRELRIVDAAGALIGTVDAARATSTLYPGAGYLHRTEPFRVVELDFDRGEATVEPDDGTTTTRADSVTDLELLGTDAEVRLGALDISLGPVAVRHEVTGYARIDIVTRQVVDRVPLTLPPESLVTRAVRYVFAPEVIAAAALDPEQIPGSLHALEHALIAMLPLFAICDRWDVGGLSMPWHSDTHAALIAVYDGYPGGAGIAELGYDASERHLTTTLEMLEACPCHGGCPSCVQSPKCGNGNEPLDKTGAIALARAALGSSTADGTA